MSKRKKVSTFPAQSAFTRPKTDIPMTPDMQMILSGLEENIAIQRRGLQLAEQRYGAYVVQCAEKLNVNDRRFLFQSESRTFIDNPEFKEPEVKDDHSGTASPS